MTVVCVSNTFSVGMALLTREGITIGKSYIVEEISYAVNMPECFYLIKDDSGDFINHHSQHFKKISELRDDKLNELGI